MTQRTASGPLPTADPSEQILTTGPWLHDGGVGTMTVGLLVGLIVIVWFLARRRRSPSAH